MFVSFQDTILDAIRKTKVNFVRCILPVEIAGQFDSVDGESVSKTGKEVSSMNVPLARNQLRSAEMLDAVRIHRQGGLTVVLRLGHDCGSQTGAKCSFSLESN